MGFFSFHFWTDPTGFKVKSSGMLGGLICRKWWTEKPHPNQERAAVTHLIWVTAAASLSSFVLVQSSWGSSFLVESCEDKECPGGRVGSSPCGLCRSPGAAQSRHSEHRGAVTDTNTFQNILHCSFGGRCDTASNICFFVSTGTTAQWFNNKTTSILGVWESSLIFVLS